MLITIFFSIKSKKIKNDIFSYTYICVLIFYTVSGIKSKTCFILIN